MSNSAMVAVAICCILVLLAVFIVLIIVRHRHTAVAWQPWLAPLTTTSTTTTIITNTTTITTITTSIIISAMTSFALGHRCQHPSPISKNESNLSHSATQQNHDTKSLEDPSICHDRHFRRCRRRRHRRASSGFACLLRMFGIFWKSSSGKPIFSANNLLHAPPPPPRPQYFSPRAPPVASFFSVAALRAFAPCSRRVRNNTISPPTGTNTSIVHHQHHCHHQHRHRPISHQHTSQQNTFHHEHGMKSFTNQFYTAVCKGANTLV
ncbi:hypothetical protein AND_007073 [Anopheles darlingi]|uniref:Uncharacterized protein n=1 Tax=Anopheles darlingi TaxID=43151 RepID=W5JD38_ANODA|nr:hypothetical protein AND_007073 [Anopheles darlingi]